MRTKSQLSKPQGVHLFTVFLREKSLKMDQKREFLQSSLGHGPGCGDDGGGAGGAGGDCCHD